ncbi:MAG: hypothetical protein ABI210_14315, partial [Abditibacteriaceae bacterium]
MTPIEQPPVDALNAPLPPSFRERALRHRTPLALIILGSAVLHILFLGFVMGHQPTAPPHEKLIEIDLREPEPVKKVAKPKPKPLKVIKHIAPPPVRLKSAPKPKNNIFPVVKPSKPVPVKPTPKITKVEKPIKELPLIKPPLPNPLSKPLSKPRPAINSAKPSPAPRAVSELPRDARNKPTPSQLSKSFHAGAMPKPSSNAGESKGHGRPKRGDEAAPAPGLSSAGRIAMAPSAHPTRSTNPFNGLDANQSTTGGNKSSGQQTPLPLGERAQRLAAGTALS